MFAETVVPHPTTVVSILLCNLHLKQGSAVELSKTEVPCWK